MIRRPPRSTRTDTLSLHDALPISPGATAAARSAARRCRARCFRPECGHRHTSPRRPGLGSGVQRASSATARGGLDAGTSPACRGWDPLFRGLAELVDELVGRPAHLGLAHLERMIVLRVREHRTLADDLEPGAAAPPVAERVTAPMGTAS